MRCDDPHLNEGGSVFGCGQCGCCRINRRRVWTHRFLLEAREHQQSCFVTLTYSSSFLPTDGSLRPGDLQLFLKRLRKCISPVGLRFFAVGEYGSKTWRPHFHAILFGFPECVRGGQEMLKRCTVRSSCEPCRVLRSCWGMGFILNGSFNFQRAAYCCGYIQKKMTAPDDERLRGRHPEFSRMSLKPGLGFGPMHDVASDLLSGGDFVDVPSSLPFGEGSSLPLGRYLRRNLRLLVGRDPLMPLAALRVDPEIYAARLAARSDSAVPSARSRILEICVSRAARLEAVASSRRRRYGRRI